MKEMKIVNLAGFYMRVQLRHCLALLLFAVIPYNSFAITACVSNDTRAVVLNPNISGRGGYGAYVNNATQIWSAEFSYGKIYGTAACLSSNYGMEAYGIYRENKGMLLDNGAKVVGGEANGTHCWCKLIYPAVSLWVYDSSYGYNTIDECTGYGSTTATGCVQRCSGHVGNYSSAEAAYKIRYSLFSAIE